MSITIDDPKGLGIINDMMRNQERFIAQEEALKEEFKPGAQLLADKHAAQLSELLAAQRKEQDELMQPMKDRHKAIFVAGSALQNEEEARLFRHMSISRDSFKIAAINTKHIEDGVVELLNDEEYKAARPENPLAQLADALGLGDKPLPEGLLKEALPSSGATREEPHTLGELLSVLSSKHAS